MNIALTDIALLDTLNAATVFAPGGVDAVLKKIRDEVSSFQGDISTSTGRDEIRSLAFKVARSKTALDELGKNLVADLKKQTGAIDAERRRIRDELDTLKDQVRQPLTDWENADKERIEAHEKAILDLEALLDFGGQEPSAAQLQERIEILAGRAPRQWQEFVQRASEVSLRVGKRLEDLHAGAVRRETERAELERLRREQVERDRREREEKIAAEAAERARVEAEAKAESAARAAALADARERERLEKEAADAHARAEQAERDRIASEKKAHADTLAAAQKAERDRLQAIEDERRRVADAAAKEAAETARRESDKKHKANINNQVLDALVLASAGNGSKSLSKEQAVAIITAIAQGKIPHLKISY